MVTHPGTRLHAAVLHLTLASVAIASLTLAGCFRVKRSSLVALDEQKPQVVESPVRAFLADGSVVLFPEGAVVSEDAIQGRGEHYDLLRRPVGPARTVPLDSVLGLEAFKEDTNVGLSLALSAGATVAAVVAGVAIACAADPKCFGSCPTVYSVDAHGERLEAEAFSYSISPLLEARDTDLLSVAANGGRVALEIRNEALETHYINHLELVEVRHPAHTRVVTDPDNVPFLVGTLRPLARVVDRDGRDVGAELADRDRHVFASSAHRVSRAGRGEERDWIEATLPPIDADTAALVLRLRNSLLNTVLFYELMLNAQGARALDWMARDIERIGNAVELGSWFHRTMGLRLEVESDDGFQEVTRFGDTGPIAWKEMAFRVPVRPDRSTRVRLSFLADEWRIDELRWSADVRPASSVRTLPVGSITPLGGAVHDDLEGRIAAADDEYLVTSAGTGFEVVFDVGDEPDDGRRTFLLSTQGYYTEWIRPVWIRGTSVREPFRPSETTVPALMARWQEVQGPMEAAFHATRIPVR